MSKNSETKTLGKAVQIDHARIQDHPGELVRGTIEEKKWSPKFGQCCKVESA